MSPTNTLTSHDIHLIYSWHMSYIPKCSISKPSLLSSSPHLKSIYLKWSVLRAPAKIFKQGIWYILLGVESFILVNIFLLYPLIPLFASLEKKEKIKQQYHSLSCSSELKMNIIQLSFLFTILKKYGNTSYFMIYCILKDTLSWVQMIIFDYN